MADKPTYTSITAGARQNATTTNANNEALALAVQGCLGRGGTGESPNSMTGDLDLDLHKIKNVGAGSAASDAARLQDIIDAADLDSGLANFRVELGDTTGASLVGYGSQTVEEALDTQFTHKFNILDYGAVGDYSGGTGTDNTAAFDAANAAAAAAGGGIIVVPNAPLPYWLPEGFAFTADNTTLLGEGGVIQYGPSTYTYNHCIRVSGDRQKVLRLQIQCENALVRNDTGFGIVLNTATQATISNNLLLRIASAAIWAVDSSDFTITNNIINSPKADGIHAANNCSSFVIANNVVAGCNDDSIAVGGDVLLDPQPTIGVVANNTIRDSTTGHGLLCFNATKIAFIGNLISNVGFCGFASYRYVAANCSYISIIGNTFLGTGAYATTDATNATIYVDGLENSIIVGNQINGPQDGGFPQNGIILQSYNNLTIKDNVIYGCSDYGITYIPTLATAKEYLVDLKIIDNHIINCGVGGIFFDEAAADPDGIYITGNTFDNVADSGTYVIYVSNAGIYPLVITHNQNLSDTKTISYDTATCTAARVSDNSPSMITWTPTVTSEAGTITSYTVDYAKWQRVGDIVSYVFKVTVVDKGTASGAILITLPITGVAQGSVCGREGVLTGYALTGTHNGAQVGIYYYNNSTVLVTGAQITCTGQYPVV